MQRFLTILLLLCAATAMRAAGNAAVKDVHINVQIMPNGDAHFTEIWTVDVRRGTEWYLGRENLGAMEIRDLTVTDETGRLYTDEGAWKTDRTLQQKAGRCGIVDKGDGDYEICWGIGSLGEHSFTVSYRLTHFLRRLTDADAFNHMFVNPMPDAPEHVLLSIRPADSSTVLTPDNTRVWAFGFLGNVYVTDGAVVAETAGPMQGDEASVIVMVCFDLDLFGPAAQRSGTFEEMKERALEGSDYGTGEGEVPLWLAIVVLVAIALVLLLLIIYVVLEYTGVTSSRPVYGRCRVRTWSRDIPLNGSLTAAYHVLSEARPLLGDYSERRFLSALILRFVYQGIVQVKGERHSTLRMLSFEGPPPAPSQFEGIVDRELYHILRQASGSNLLLEANELKHWGESEENGRVMHRWINNLSDRCGIICMAQKLEDGQGHFTKEGQAKARGVPELRNYLRDFSLLSERGVDDVALWDDYLVYATLFGIAQRVTEAFRRINPDYFHMGDRSIDPVGTVILANSFSQSFRHGSSSYEAAQQRASGGGGRASFSGGGGHSGGGGGGAR
ncbi:hypothetical protein BHU16_00385 [Tannerella sp. oral taxon 808]|nr:hypothetical protein BHU16_00385 [Tannerella sp. oral taxon 808]